MVVPAAPTAGEPIAEAWGDVVHDAVVAQDIQSGIGSLSFTNTVVSGIVTVTFARPFATPPVVQLTAGSNAIAPNLSIGIRSGPTTTTFDVQAREVREVAQTATLPFHWIAIGPRA